MDLTGKIFTRLTAVSSFRTPNGKKWICSCSCGNTHVASTSHLNAGAVRSCGCLNNEGRSKKSDNFAVRFWSRVLKTPDGRLGRCWLWVGEVDKDGYGRVKHKGRGHRTHRMSWELTNGQIPKGILVLHTCDNPTCVRPSHLFLGTTQDNIDDKTRKGRAPGRRKLATKLTTQEWGM